MSQSTSACFVGIDLGKADAVVCVLDEDKQICLKESVPRQAVQLDELGARLAGRGAIVVMEATGGLEKLPAAILEQHGVAVVVVNPAQAKHFALSQGQLEKHDRVDAYALALWAFERRPAARRRPNPDVELLAVLESRRQSLVARRAAEKVALRQENLAICRGSIEQMIAHYDAEIAKIEAARRELIASCETLAARQRQLLTVPGVGEQTAACLLATLPELGEISGKQISKLSGLAPMVRQSGKWQGVMMIRGGRSTPRSALYMAVLSAVRLEGPVRQFYLQLVERGKPKKLALTAASRKLLVMINAMLAHGQTWQPRLAA